MARSAQTVSTLVRGAFAVYDSSNVAVTGLVQGNFTTLLAKNNVDDATAITITEIGSGRYGYSFTPASTGYWMVLIRNTTNAPRGWNDEYDVS